MDVTRFITNERTKNFISDIYGELSPYFGGITRIDKYVLMTKLALELATL